MIRVLIAEDHPLFRAALRHVIEGLFAERQIFEAGSLDEALALVTGRDLDLDVIMLDLRMPGSEGFSGLIALRSAVPDVPIIVVSASSSPEIMRDAIVYGAAGFIPKSFCKDEIADGVRRVINSEVFLPADATDASERADWRAPLRDRMATLTQGELRVLQLVACGKSNKIIAYELGIKESTVKAHITSILRKLRVHSRTQAVIAARELDAT